MACEQELAEVERLQHLMEEENQDYWISVAKTVGAGIGVVGGAFVAISTSPTGVGTYGGAAAATASAFSFGANWASAADAADDYDRLETEYKTACQSYRDCIG